MQFAFCLGIRDASHRSPVVNRIRATRFQSILNRYLRWWWSIQLSGKGREPFARRKGSIIRKQIGPRIALLCCRDGGDRRVLDVQPRPDAFAIPDDRELLLS